MVFTGVFLFSLCVVGAWGQCCPPELFEVTEDVYAEVRKNGQTEITRGMQRVSYDAENSRLRVHGIDYNKNIVSDVIMDYKNGKEYVWANGYCRVLPAGNFSKSCVPEGAKLLTRTFMGSPPNDIPVQMYSFEKDTNEMFATVTEDCVPIEAHFSSAEKGYIEFIVYSNFTVGIKDTSVFTPPDICHTQQMTSPHVAGRRRRGLSLF
ncbi:mammalian ependymin-related protein 1-like [Crassostrea virginica]